jgi:hypothetical protein
LADSVAKVGAAVTGVAQVDDGADIVVLGGRAKVQQKTKGTIRLDVKREGTHLLEAKVQAQEYGHAKQAADETDEGEVAVASRDTRHPSTKSDAQPVQQRRRG